MEAKEPRTRLPDSELPVTMDNVSDDAGSKGPGFTRASPAAHLEQYRWKPGQRVPGAGKPKGLVSVRRRFREAFSEAPPKDAVSLVEVVLAMARGHIVQAGEDGQYAVVESKNQMAAIKFCAEYGFGPPPKSIDDESATKIAENMLTGMINEARARQAQAGAIDVAAKVDKP